ncbi:MAG: galactose-1-phosphate uridylyltransferase [Sciscionella sp.]|nr:galactose-1-phosphate uridylyltransferase [Sciscionella sp.]
MRRTSNRLADGREIIYFDDTETAARTAVDSRELPELTLNSEIRRDPLTGEWLVIATHRQGRTYKPPPRFCPLCPSSPGNATEIPERDYDVVVFENRFPSFAHPAAIELSTVDGMPMVLTAPGNGRCEVVCFTADHGSSFGELPVSRVRTVLDALADRTEALSKLPGIAQVFPFENRGEEIGVTLSHPHGQIYGYPFVPPKTATMLDVAGRYLAEHGRPLMADVLAAEQKSGRRVIASCSRWTAFVPAAARWPVEVHVVPHRQVPDLAALREDERDDFAALYLDVLRRLDGLYGRPLPYIAAWHQAPVRDRRELGWLHLEVFSILRAVDKLKYLAGSESGMAVWINDVSPETMADRLRGQH